MTTTGNTQQQNPPTVVFATQQALPAPTSLAARNAPTHVRYGNGSGAGPGRRDATEGQQRRAENGAGPSRTPPSGSASGWDISDESVIKAVESEGHPISVQKLALKLLGNDETKLQSSVYKRLRTVLKNLRFNKRLYENYHHQWLPWKKDQQPSGPLGVPPTPHPGKPTPDPSTGPAPNDSASAPPRPNQRSYASVLRRDLGLPPRHPPTGPRISDKPPATSSKPSEPSQPSSAALSTSHITHISSVLISATLSESCSALAAETTEGQVEGQIPGPLRSDDKTAEIDRSDKTNHPPAKPAVTVELLQQAPVASQSNGGTHPPHPTAHVELDVDVKHVKPATDTSVPPTTTTPSTTTLSTTTASDSITAASPPTAPTISTTTPVDTPATSMQMISTHVEGVSSGAGMSGHSANLLPDVADVADVASDGTATVARAVPRSATYYATGGTQNGYVQGYVGHDFGHGPMKQQQQQQQWVGDSGGDGTSSSSLEVQVDVQETVEAQDGQGESAEEDVSADGGAETQDGVDYDGYEGYEPQGPQYMHYNGQGHNAQGTSQAVDMQGQPHAHPHGWGWGHGPEPVGMGQMYAQQDSGGLAPQGMYGTYPTPYQAMAPHLQPIGNSPMPFAGPHSNPIQLPPLPAQPQIVTAIDATTFRDALRVVQTDFPCIRRFIFTTPDLLVQANSPVDSIHLVEPIVDNPPYENVHPSRTSSATDRKSVKIQTAESDRPDRSERSERKSAKQASTTAAFCVLATLMKFAPHCQSLTAQPTIVNIFSKDPLMPHVARELSAVGFSVEIIKSLEKP